MIRYHFSKPDTLINLLSHYYVVAFNKTLSVLVAYAVVSIVDIALTYYYVVYVGGFIELNPLVAKYMLSNPFLWFTLDFGGFTLMGISYRELKGGVWGTVSSIRKGEGNLI